jgi:CxxC-x17-CxxC domain-containing protein
MKKTIKRKSAPVESAVEEKIEQPVAPDMADLIIKMQQQLLSLEGKIDALIARSAERPSGGNSFSRPFQSQRFDNAPRYDNSQRFGRGDRDNNYRERSFNKAICADCGTQCEVPFKPTGDRPVYCKECFSKHKDGPGSFKGKFERNPREGGFSKFRNFDKPQGRENHRSGGGKKPAFRRGRKERA